MMAGRYAHANCSGVISGSVSCAAGSAGSSATSAA